MQIPNSRPRMISSEARRIIEHFGVDLNKYPCVNIAIPGYYLDSLGEKGKNDIGIYDDSISFYTQNVYASFNANTDPSRIKPNVATVKTDSAYYCHIIGIHGGKTSQYPAICQREGPITVFRSGTENVAAGTKDKRGECLGNGYWVGYFGINIHKGGYNTTSSEGCQTIYPTQWDSYFELAKSEMIRAFGTSSYKKEIIPLISLSEQKRRSL